MTPREYQIKESLLAKQAKAQKPNIVQPHLTESELYYLYKNLYRRKEQI